MMPSPLDALPVFASDFDIAVALVGKKAAPDWIRSRLPAIEKVPGFPKVDALHGGRPVPLVKLFYENYLRLPASGSGLPDGDEDEGAWKRPRRKA
jgi:hypothetical protein